jgi:PTS system nitrogen regulatory IIA component
LTGQPAAEIFEALNDRESLGSTGLGNGIAVPHGKYAPLKGVMAVFMRLPSPVDFESVDDQPVDIVMMLLAPMGAGADHLKALARVARVLRTDSVADALRHSSDPATLYRILTQPLESTKAA